MNVNKLLFIIICSFNSFIIPMEPKLQTTEMAIVCVEDSKPRIENQDNKCCKSSAKFKVAVVGLVSTTLTAIVVLVVHFTKC